MRAIQESLSHLSVPLPHTSTNAGRTRTASLGDMGLRPEIPRLLSGLPTPLSTELFASAERVRLSAGDVLFRAGDSGDGCYRVEDGLLKVTIVSSSGGERVLAFIGRGAVVGELSIIDGLPRFCGICSEPNRSKRTLHFRHRAKNGHGLQGGRGLARRNYTK